MKRLLFTLLCTFIVGAVAAQDNQQSLRKNTLFLELGGNGGYYSVNYDRIVLVKEKWKLAWRIGAMFYREELNYLEDEQQLTFAVPIELSYLKGKGNHFLELGLGVTPVHQNYIDFEESKVNDLAMFAAGRIGYRYQRREGGLFFKAGITPMLQFDNSLSNKRDSFILPWAGLAIGYTFKR